MTLIEDVKLATLFDMTEDGTSPDHSQTIKEALATSANANGSEVPILQVTERSVEDYLGLKKEIEKQ